LPDSSLEPKLGGQPLTATKAELWIGGGEEVRRAGKEIAKN